MTIAFDPSEYINEQYVQNLETINLGDPSKNYRRVILYDGSGNEVAPYVENITVEDLAIALRLTLVNALNHQIATEPNGGRLRVVLDAGPGAQTLAAVTSVTNLAGFVGMTTMPAMPYRDGIIAPQDRIVWANCVRNKIT